MSGDRIDPPDRPTAWVPKPIGEGGPRGDEPTGRKKRKRDRRDKPGSGEEKRPADDLEDPDAPPHLVDIRT